MTGTDHMESHGNARGTWPSQSPQQAQGSAGAAELSLRQEHYCEPCVSWDQSPLPAAQQALLRSGVGGKKPLWLARALEGITCVPKDGLPCSQRHLWCGKGKKRAKVIPLDPRPAPFAQTSPDSTSSTPHRTDAAAPERSPAPQNSQDTLDPSKGLGWGGEPMRG